MIRFQITIKNPYNCQCNQTQVIKNQSSLAENLIKHNSNLAKYLSKYQVQKQQYPPKTYSLNQRQPVGIVQQRKLRPIITNEKQKSNTNKEQPHISPNQFKSPRNKESENKGQRQTSKVQKKRKSSPSEQKSKGHMPKSPRNKQQKTNAQLKQKAKQSRYLSDTAFRKYFNRQVFQNYGRMNTSGIADGIVYNNYLKTHNINPHTGFNQPVSQQTYKNALVSGSPDKYLVPGQDYYGNDRSKHSLNLLSRSKSSQQIHNVSRSNPNLNQNQEDKNYSLSSRFHQNCNRVDQGQQNYLKNPCNVSQIRHNADKHKRIKQKYDSLHLSNSKHIPNKQKEFDHKQKRKVYSNAGLLVSKQQQTNKNSNINLNRNSQKSVKFKTQQVQANIRNQQPRILQYSQQKSISYMNRDNQQDEQFGQGEKREKMINQYQAQYQRIINDQSSIPLQNQPIEQHQNSYGNVNVKRVQSSYKIEKSQDKQLSRDRSDQRVYQVQNVCRICNSQIVNNQGINKHQTHSNLNESSNFYNERSNMSPYNRADIFRKKNLSQYEQQYVRQQQNEDHYDRNGMNNQQQYKNYGNNSIYRTNTNYRHNKHVHQTCCCHMEGVYRCKCCIENIKEKIIQRVSRDQELAKKILMSAEGRI